MDERGFTLVELTVAMAIGVIVLFAAFALLDLATRNAGRVTDRVDAEATGRTAMQQMMREIRSGCTASHAVPVQPGSDGTTLILLTGFGTETDPQVERHDISFAGGQLVDTQKNPTTGATLGARTLIPLARFGPGVGQATVTPPDGSAPVLVPYFRYYGYDPTTRQIASAPLATPIAAANTRAAAVANAANHVVEVVVSYIANARSSTEARRAASFSNTATLRFEPVPLADASSPNGVWNGLSACA